MFKESTPYSRDVGRNSNISKPRIVDTLLKNVILLKNKAYRPNAHLLYIVRHYNGNIMVIMAFTLFTFTFTLLF